jgi:hypothetical protein
MGVNRTDYIIFGFKVSPKEIETRNIDLWTGKYLPYLEGQKDILYIIINDGMCGEYLVFGKLINQAVDYEGTTFTVISYKDFFDDEENKKVTQAFIDLFGKEVYDTLDDEEPQMLVFSHFS